METVEILERLLAPACLSWFGSLNGSVAVPPGGCSANRLTLFHPVNFTPANRNTAGSSAHVTTLTTIGPLAGLQRALTLTCDSLYGFDTVCLIACEQKTIATETSGLRLKITDQ